MECVFCQSASQDSYIYTECAHLVCLACAAAKWDQKYSIKCCNKTTFLEEETELALQRLNREQRHPKKDQSKENLNPPNDKPFTVTKTVPKDDYPQKRELQSIYTTDFEGKSSEKQASQDQKCLADMQEAMEESVQRIKFTFEMHRKQLERKEECLLKEVYNRYSDQFARQSFSQEEAREFKEKVNKLIGEELSSLTKCAPKEPQSRPDKILEKLEYNQQKMKEKFNRHYELLK